MTVHVLTNEEVLEILKLVEETDYDDVRLEIGELRIHVRKRGVGGGDVPAAEITANNTAPLPIAAPASEAVPSVTATVSEGAPAPPALAAAPADERGIAVRAPMLGTFYRAPAPGEKPFVEVGSRVSPEDTVGLVEVMKLFNSIKAGTAGVVTSIPAENGALVEFGQVLVRIEPV